MYDRTAEVCLCAHRSCGTDTTHETQRQTVRSETTVLSGRPGALHQYLLAAKLAAKLVPRAPLTVTQSDKYSNII